MMKKLRILTMSNNLVREWVEFMRLAEMPNLKELVFVGRPAYQFLIVPITRELTQSD
jgi:dynein light chain 1